MDSKTLSTAVEQFSLRFINELDKSQSAVSSPLSAEFVLALLALGTSGAAHEELVTSLGIPDDDAVRTLFSSMTTKLKSIKGVTLNVANKLYIMDGAYELQPKMKDDAVKVFDAALEKVNFSDSSNAADLINKWVEGKTNQRIKNLISANDLSMLTRLVLVNAIYFKGTWKQQFDPIHTRDQPFYLNAKSTVNIPMMFKEEKYRYGFNEDLQVQYLEIPYVGDEASMLIVLPNEVEGLNNVLTALAAGHSLLNDINNMEVTKVRLTLPKFKIETEIDLKSLLPKLGISSIFREGHSGLTKLLNTDEELVVSKAIQKAFIEVNEEGAEAAAATGMVMMMRCAQMSAPTFRADRPFLYAMLDSQRTPLFIGHYNGTPS